MKNQLFVISGETWDALSKEEVLATAKAMVEMGIFKLPYPMVDIWVGACNSIGWNLMKAIHEAGETMEGLRKDVERGLFELNEDETLYKPTANSGFVFEFCNVVLGQDKLDCAMHATPKTLSGQYYKCRSTPPVRDWDCGQFSAYLCAALIVLLGTRNAVKNTRENKLAKFGIGKKLDSKYRYVTTISLPRPADMENDEDHPPGATKRPHLRRGHVRRQHYGPKNSLVKLKWIEPVFVNADPAWVDTRERYNVSL
jgi:hypothetical protein